MQTIEYRTMDKSSWGAGPWQDEPDKKQWQDAATGLPCLIVRNRGGALCGYVGVAFGHPWHGKEYDTPDVEVHGGLTFADRCAKGADEAEHICHKPDAGEPADVWWFGFDCAHAWDQSPGYDALSPTHLRDSHDVYRDVAYVESECASLAKQIAAVHP